MFLAYVVAEPKEVCSISGGFSHIWINTYDDDGDDDGDDDDDNDDDDDDERPFHIRGFNTCVYVFIVKWVGGGVCLFSTSNGVGRSGLYLVAWCYEGVQMCYAGGIKVLCGVTWL